MFTFEAISLAVLDMNYIKFVEIAFHMWGTQQGHPSSKQHEHIWKIQLRVGTWVEHAGGRT